MLPRIICLIPVVIISLLSTPGYGCPTDVAAVQKQISENKAVNVTWTLKNDIGPERLNHDPGIDNTTPLHWAARNNCLQLAKLIISEGMTRESGQEVSIDAVDDAGFTPLHWAIQQNQKAMVQLLLENGANVRIKIPNILIGNKDDPYSLKVVENINAIELAELIKNTEIIALVEKYRWENWWEFWTWW